MGVLSTGDKSAGHPSCPQHTHTWWTHALTCVCSSRINTQPTTHIHTAHVTHMHPYTPHTLPTEHTCAQAMHTVHPRVPTRAHTLTWECAVHTPVLALGPCPALHCCEDTGSTHRPTHVHTRCIKHTSPRFPAVFWEQKACSGLCAARGAAAGVETLPGKECVAPHVLSEVRTANPRTAPPPRGDSDFR